MITQSTQTLDTMNAILRLIPRFASKESCMEFVIEECAEAINAAQKYKRRRNTIEEFNSELCDVIIAALITLHKNGMPTEEALAYILKQMNKHGKGGE